MRAKVAKRINKLAKILELTRGEKKLVKREYLSNPERSTKELDERIERAERTHGAANS